MSQPAALYCYCGTRVPFVNITEHLTHCSVRTESSPLSTLSRRLKENSTLEQLKLYLQELHAEFQIMQEYIQTKEVPAKPALVAVRPAPLPVLERPVQGGRGRPMEEEKKEVVRPAELYRPPMDPPRPMEPLRPIEPMRPIEPPKSIEPLRGMEIPQKGGRRSPSPVDAGIKCGACGRSWGDAFSEVQFLDCNHIVCKEHLVATFEEEYRRNQQLKCPVRGCSFVLSVGEVKELVGEQRFDELMMALVVGDGEVIANCSCGISITLESARIDYNQKDQNGVKFSREAAEHFAKYRFRCPKCTTISCAKCKEAPYHEGTTCEQFKIFKAAKKCRFCGEKLPNGKEVCGKPECRERLDRVCKKVLRCGHICYGVNKEAICPPCLHESCARDGHNEFEYCTICYTEGLGNAPIVQLSCGHLLHYHCVATTLANRWVGPRITFTFATCPQCKEWAFTPNNRELLEKMQAFKALYDDIVDKGVKRLKFEGEDRDPRIVTEGAAYFNNPQKFAMDRLCYYECFKCHKPYFGGKKDCAQQDAGKKYDPSELVCPTCVAENMPGTANCQKHGTEFIEFKCKFCCDHAAWFCWGNTHFCEKCHTRQNAGDYVSRLPKDKLPRCPGPRDCPLKMRHPPNGEEFALGCSMCRNVISDF